MINCITKLHIHQQVRSKTPILGSYFTSNQTLEIENTKGEHRLEDTEARAEEDINDVMPPESDSGNDGDHGPGPSGGEEQINGESVVSCKPATNEDCDTWTAEIREEWVSGEGEDGGDEADAGGVAAREGKVVDRNDGVVLGVICVGGAGSADEEFEESDKEEVKEGAEEEGKEEVGPESGGGGGGEV